jgi:hypothetical protein
MTSEKLMEELFYIAYNQGLMEELHKRTEKITKEYHTPIATAVPIAFQSMKRDGLIHDEE